MSSKKILIGVLAGAVVGAMLGILFAPDKGSAMRKKIYKKSGDFMDSINKKFEKKKEEATALAENGK